MDRKNLARYRTMDLGLFALLLTVFETVIWTASTKWFPQEAWTVSLTPVLTALLLIRWGPWAGIHAALGGAVLCFLAQAAPLQWLVYVGGNLFSLLSLPLLKLFGGKEEITARSGKALLFGLLVLLLMQTGRALLSLITGTPGALLPGFYTTEVVTDLFTLVTLWILRRLDGMLEDQEHYLTRLREAEKNP